MNADNIDLVIKIATAAVIGAGTIVATGYKFIEARIDARVNLIVKGLDDKINSLTSKVEELQRNKTNTNLHLIDAISEAATLDAKQVMDHLVKALLELNGDDPDAAQVISQAVRR